MEQTYWLAIVLSIYWGVRSLYLFAHLRYTESDVTILTKFFMYSYQFIFNFVGSLTGWICFYALLSNGINGFSDFVLLFIALLGITGHLPQLLYGIVEIPESIASKLKATTNQITLIEKPGKTNIE